jgi:hypothetical protein
MPRRTLNANKKKVPSKRAKGKRHPGGRPTKFKSEYSEQVYKLAIEGFTDKKIADFFKVDERTVNNWKDKHPEFFQSLKRGKDDFDTNVIEKSLAKRATGYQCAEVTRAISKEVDLSTGKAKLVTVKEVTKEVAPDPTSMIFWLKNRQPQRWRDKRTIEAGVNLEDILAALPEDFREGVIKELRKILSERRNKP